MILHNRSTCPKCRSHDIRVELKKKRDGSPRESRYCHPCRVADRQRRHLIRTGQDVSGCEWTAWQVAWEREMAS